MEFSEIYLGDVKFEIFINRIENQLKRGRISNFLIRTVENQLERSQITNI